MISIKMFQKPPRQKSIVWGENKGSPRPSPLLSVSYRNIPYNISHEKGVRWQLKKFWKCFSKYGPQTKSRARPGNLLELQIFKPHLRTTEQEILKVGPLQTIWFMLRFENHCTMWFPDITSSQKTSVTLCPFPHPLYIYPTCSHRCWVGCRI